MSLLTQIAILGIVQGLTEFFPISSSAHLVILQYIFSIKKDILLLDAILHAGSLMAIILFFYKDLLGILRDLKWMYKKSEGKKEGLKWLYLIISGTFPTAIMGILFRKGVESAFTSPKMTGALLIFTCLILFLTKFTRERSEERIVHAFIIGVFQGLALLPGISRSGATISSALALGWKRESAFKFSFILSIPAIIGANIFEILNSPMANTYPVKILLIGFFSSFLTGSLSLRMLSPLVKMGKFYLFSIYCLIAGLGILMFI